MSLTIGAPVAQQRSSAPLDLLRRGLTGEVHMPDEASYDALQAGSYTRTSTA